LRFSSRPPASTRFSITCRPFFAQAGGGLSTAFGQSVFVGLVNLGMTFLAIWLIDRLGRKPLLCIGVAGMMLSLLTISWAFYSAHAAVGGEPAVTNGTLVLVAIAAFVASFAISLGPVMWSCCPRSFQ